MAVKVLRLLERAKNWRCAGLGHSRGRASLRRQSNSRCMASINDLAAEDDELADSATRKLAHSKPQPMPK